MAWLRRGKLTADRPSPAALLVQTPDRYEFPETQQFSRNTVGMSNDEFLFYQVVDERAQNLLRPFPECVGVATGWLPSDVNLSSGQVSFGGFSMWVGEEGMHLMDLKRVDVSDSRWLSIPAYVPIFREHSAAFLVFNFQSVRARPTRQFVVGFATETAADTFAMKFTSRFSQDVGGVS